MHRLRALLFLTLLVSSLAPYVAQAADLPLFDASWHIVPDAHDLDASCPIGAPLAFGGVLQLIQNVMNAAVSLTVLIGTLVVVYAGILWMTATANAENITKARGALTNAVIGMIIVLGAWVGVDFVMKVLYSGADGQQGKFGPWNTILGTGGSACVEEDATAGGAFFGNLNLIVNPPTPGGGGTTGGGTSGGGGTAGGGGGAGSCTVPTSGPCSVAKLEPTFGSVASQAAQICTAESTANPQKLSGSDRMDDGRAYSVGLFQINLTNSFNYKVNGQKCDNAFTKPCQSPNVVTSGSQIGKCHTAVIDERLYQGCVAAAQNPAINIQAAKALYDGDWGRWSTAKVCNLPR
jgi:hypothetical protein